MIEAFRRWFLDRHTNIERDGVRLGLSEGSRGLVKNGISAAFSSAHSEALIELWETGESEFYFADWKTADRDPNYQPEVTHYDFHNEGEMFTALDAFVKRMSEDDEPSSIAENWPISGYSKTVYYPPLGKPSTVPAVKGGSK